MRFSTLATLVALAVSPIFVLASPTPQRDGATTDWTYRDIYNHAMEKTGGTAVAELVEEHISKTDRSWDDLYQHDIHLSGGATLTLANRPSGQAFLAKRGEPIRDSYVQAFPFVGDCNDEVSFTWNPVTVGGCYTYFDGTRNLRMFSAKVKTAGIDVTVWRESQFCQLNPGDGAATFGQPSDDACIFPTDGRGFNSFLIGPH